MVVSNGVSLAVVGGVAHTFGAAFQQLANPDSVPIVYHASAFALQASEGASMVEVDGTFNVTLPTTFSPGFQTSFLNVGAGVITFVSAAAIDGKGVTMPNQWGAATALWDGTGWLLIGDLA